MMLRGLLFLFVWLMACVPLFAHELRPAYLEIRETAPDQYSIFWKVPAVGDRRLALHVRLPDSCRSREAPVSMLDGGAYIERSLITCSPPLKGSTVIIDGLRSSLTDVLARVESLDGSIQIARLTPEAPDVFIVGTQSTPEIAKTYLLLGVEHILLGFDHLLFVLALMLLIDQRWMLLKTITAFTAAHSITLAGATLGWFSLPQRPVEACIALSIAFVAAEILRRDNAVKTGSSAAPWIMAFSFGLLHGFGFAGALKEIGLPQGDIPLALLAFNLGVEAGQLFFIAAVLTLVALARRIYQLPRVPVATALAYTIGTTSMYWLLERMAAFAA
jgi:hydrogenase/urease accessory protein HupE